METKDGRQAIQAKTSAEWRAWLAQNSQKEAGVWLILYHKKSRVESITLPEAVEEALCFGWIDSLCKRRDEGSYYLTFTPRNPRTSKWSRTNRERAEQLIQAGRMTAYGHHLIEGAKQKGNWGDVR